MRLATRERLGHADKIVDDGIVQRRGAADGEDDRLARFVDGDKEAGAAICLIAVRLVEYHIRLLEAAVPADRLQIDRLRAFQ